MMVAHVHDLNHSTFLAITVVAAISQGQAAAAGQGRGPGRWRIAGTRALVGATKHTGTNLMMESLVCEPWQNTHWGSCPCRTGAPICCGMATVTCGCRLRMAVPHLCSGAKWMRPGYAPRGIGTHVGFPTPPVVHQPHIASAPEEPLHWLLTLVFHKLGRQPEEGGLMPIVR